jgi:hypothetical protein
MQYLMYVALLSAFGSALPLCGAQTTTTSSPLGKNQAPTKAGVVAKQRAPSAVTLPIVSILEMLAPFDDGSASFAEFIGDLCSRESKKVAECLDDARAADLAALLKLKSVATNDEINKLASDFQTAAEGLRPQPGGSSTLEIDLDRAIERFRKRAHRLADRLEDSFLSYVRQEHRTDQLRDERERMNQLEFDWKYEAVFRKYPLLLGVPHR